MFKRNPYTYDARCALPSTICENIKSLGWANAFDVIAANQTLLRYGINLEKTGPDLRDELKDERPDLPRQPSPPSAVDDAADVMSGYTAPAPVIVEKEVIKEVPVEVIKEVEKVVEKEVEAEIDLSTPPAIKELEKRLEKKLNKDGKKDNS